MLDFSAAESNAFYRRNLAAGQEGFLKFLTYQLTADTTLTTREYREMWVWRELPLTPSLI